jgi:hypothetical protein
VAERSRCWVITRGAQKGARTRVTATRLSYALRRDREQNSKFLSPGSWPPLQAPMRCVPSALLLLAHSPARGGCHHKREAERQTEECVDCNCRPLCVPVGGEPLRLRLLAYSKRARACPPPAVCAPQAGASMVLPPLSSHRTRRLPPPRCSPSTARPCLCRRR